MLIVTPTRRGYMAPGRSGRPELLPTCMRCVKSGSSGVGGGVHEAACDLPTRWYDAGGNTRMQVRFLGRVDRPLGEAGGAMTRRLKCRPAIGESERSGIGRSVAHWLLSTI